LAGASINPTAYGITNWVAAANLADGYLGLPLATTIQKVYMGHSQFGILPTLQMRQLAATGCQFLISIEPSTTLTIVEQSYLTAWLAMLKLAGLNFRVVLYSESNNQAFSTAAEWLAYWSFYAPVVQAAGVSCGYDPGCNILSIARAEAYFPANPTPDELWMDYYATSFRAGARLDKLIAIAAAAGVPAGMAEWGWSSGKVVFEPMVMPWWNAYGNYLIHLVKQDHLGLGAIFWASEAQGSWVDVISGASDPRIPIVRQVAQTVQSAS